MNGFDCARYSGKPVYPENYSRPDWLQYWGMKAYDIAGSLPGVDLQFANNRKVAAALDVPYRGIYIFLRAAFSPAEQMEGFTWAVGNLGVGEFVFLDWEENIPLSEIRKMEEILQVCYPNRWGVYVNDQNDDMTEWLETRLQQDQNHRVPLIHPNWNFTVGWEEAVKWDADIWQVEGESPVGAAAPIFPNTRVSCDFVRKVHRLNVVSDRHWL